ncbi:MAG TPA: 1-(5-phosphoribosyl)-5-amino-4-imidazole-carboxylate carboxylase, partial [Desulfobacteraceae bacterium]|nr:1-(5-phosphoribosyl)-5-amino-4-imidazole-carboxylate carboxylase [Desulfobacteraceae bacterium]
MNPETLTRILTRVASGDLDIEAAKAQFKHLSFEDIGF